MSLPKILVIDDQFGKSITDRRNLCLSFAISDITGDDNNPEKIDNPVAESFFCSAQREENGVIINDTDIALTAVKKGWPHADGWFWSMALLDIRFVSGRVVKDEEPEGQAGDTDFGMRLLEEIHKSYPDIPVVMLSSRERNDVIEACRTKGAADFIQRVGYSSDTTSPKDVLKQKLFEHALLPDTRAANNGLRIVGSSLSLLKTLRSARRAATGKGNILLLGKTGTGKELLARYIHDMSPKSKGPYEVFHPFGTAETLQEDELFGHAKGAFTGAASDKAGLFEAANGGTLFIDEIGDIPEGLQLKLLRPLENRVIKRQGGSKEIAVDTQVVLATNKNLDEYARTEQFKFDLLNRINAYTITLPPLKDRKEDIHLITEKLLENLCKEHDARWPRKILPEAMDLLMSYDWPDNVRGLRNVLERAVKNNRDSELFVPTDINFEQTSAPEKTQAVVPVPETPPEDLNKLIELILGFKFPVDYSRLQGKLPELQRAVARMFANYMLSSIKVTKKMKPDGPPEGEVNLTGAASCMMGEQLRTPKAADLIKRLLQQDKVLLDNLLKDYTVLNKAYEEALRLRPKRPIK